MHNSFCISFQALEINVPIEESHNSPSSLAIGRALKDIACALFRIKNCVFELMYLALDEITLLFKFHSLVNVGKSETDRGIPGQCPCWNR